MNATPPWGTHDPHVGKYHDGGYIDPQLARTGARLAAIETIASTGLHTEDLPEIMRRLAAATSNAASRLSTGEHVISITTRDALIEHAAATPDQFQPLYPTATHHDLDAYHLTQEDQ